MTEQMINEMSHEMLMFHAFNLASGDMETALSFSDREIMDFQLETDDDTLRYFLISSLEYVEDTDSIWYAGARIVADTSDGEEFGVVEEDRYLFFPTVAEAAEYIDEENGGAIRWDESEEVE